MGVSGAMGFDAKGRSKFRLKEAAPSAGRPGDVVLQLSPFSPWSN